MTRRTLPTIGLLKKIAQAINDGCSSIRCKNHNVLRNASDRYPDLVRHVGFLQYELNDVEYANCLRAYHSDDSMSSSTIPETNALSVIDPIQAATAALDAPGINPAAKLESEKALYDLEHVAEGLERRTRSEIGALYVLISNVDRLAQKHPELRDELNAIVDQVMRAMPTEVSNHFLGQTQAVSE